MVLYCERIDVRIAPHAGLQAGQEGVSHLRGLGAERACRIHGGRCCEQGNRLDRSDLQNPPELVDGTMVNRQRLIDDSNS